MLKLLFVVNVDWFFCSHRLPIAIAALRQGFEVHLATTFTSSSRKKLLSGYGLFLHDLSVDRSGRSPTRLLKNFLEMYRIIHSVNPDIVHLITIQPVLLGGLAARAARARRVVFAISGLGHVFIASSLLSGLRRFLVERLYQSALATKCRAIIFQNQEDQFKLGNLCSLSAKESYLIPGSGVNLSAFCSRPLLEAQPIVLMASRLLITKGVREFVEAASILRKRGNGARFLLVGDPDLPNPASITFAELNAWRDQGLVEISGYRNDLNEIIARAHIVCLPSYREGLPKVLCEAAACGCAVVTTDEPGCRDAIENGVTGLLVPSRDSLALANAIEHLLLNPDLIRSMGLAGRKRAEQLFDINTIVDQHLNIYYSLLEPS